jgi:glycosyltransferase
MKISIVTAVYNRAATIGQALDSVASQTYPNIEHIVIDGASTDSTLDEIGKRAYPQIRLISEPDKGIYDALNKGIAAATGEVIGLMHSDDFYASDRVLEDVMRAFAEADAEAVYGDLLYVSTNDTDRIVRRWIARPYTTGLLAKGWMPPHPTLFLRREVFDRFGAYDTSYQIAADYDAVLRWFGNGGIRARYLPQVLVKMRVGGESNRSLGRILRKSSEDYRALRSNGVGGVQTLIWKNLIKIPQFLRKIEEI